MSDQNGNQDMRALQSVCVYCGSSNAAADIYKESARAAGALLAQQGVDVVYGGGNVGLMGIVADAALQGGAKVTGIIPRHIQDREVAHLGLNELITVDTMHERKTLMVEKSDAFLILPGGFGTMDEFFEIVTWRQLKLHSKPVVIANINGFWDPLLGLLDHIIEARFARESDRHFMSVASTIEGAVQALFLAPAETEDPSTKWM